MLDKTVVTKEHCPFIVLLLHGDSGIATPLDNVAYSKNWASATYFQAPFSASTGSTTCPIVQTITNDFLTRSKDRYSKYYSSLERPAQDFVARNNLVRPQLTEALRLDSELHWTDVIEVTDREFGQIEIYDDEIDAQLRGTFDPAT